LSGFRKIEDYGVFSCRPGPDMMRSGGEYVVDVLLAVELEGNESVLDETDGGAEYEGAEEVDEGGEYVGDDEE
jgi:hypothetical protein